ncbi:MAG: hypothetical protein AB1757_07410 [Acidobacteriota bacterium]
MLKTLRVNWRGSEAQLERKLHRYYLACCRAIWRLLPQEESRRGIEVAERYVDGLATDEELNKADWHVEGAAFNIDYNCDPNAIEKWIEEVQAIPRDELSAMIHPIEEIADVSPRELLERAAYFADFAVIYPHLTPKDPSGDYIPFLSASLLREIFGDLLCSE